METESGAKIAIRGKGSVKEGKGRSDAAHTSNQEEDLHCLIMADTEEKVNKAKKLIHNVIETVSKKPCPFLDKDTNKTNRLLQFRRVKTSLREISFVNSLLSTVLCVMTRIKLVRIVARLVIASMIALSRRTSPPTSFAESVVMLDIWPVTVLIDSAVLTGATDQHQQLLEAFLVDQPQELEAAMQLTVNMR